MLLERADQAISSTELQKSTRWLLDRMANGQQDRYVVIRDNRPTACYEALIDELEDLRIDAVARERLVAIDQMTLLSHADLLARLGSAG